jgi:hypothetical protein
MPYPLQKTDTLEETAFSHRAIGPDISFFAHSTTPESFPQAYSAQKLLASYKPPSPAPVRS